MTAQTLKDIKYRLQNEYAENDKVSIWLLTDVIDMLLDASAEPEQITRPAIGEQFWLRGRFEHEWSVWTATPDGPATHDADGELFEWTWSKFDSNVADGTWKWMALEQPHD